MLEAQNTCTPWYQIPDLAIEYKRETCFSLATKQRGKEVNLLEFVVVFDLRESSESIIDEIYHDLTSMRTIYSNLKHNEWRRTIEFHIINHCRFYKMEER